MKFIADPAVLKQLAEWSDTFVKRLQVEMQNQGINASGNLSNSLEYTIEEEGDGTHITILADPYFFYAEHGRRAGKVPYLFADILAEWAQDKRITLPSKFKDYRQFGWAISQKIRFYGSRRYREQDPADVVSPVMDEMYPKLGEILESRIMMYVNDELFNWN